MLPQGKEQNKIGDVWYFCIVHMSNWPKYAHQFIVMRLRPCHEPNYRPFFMEVLYESKPFVFKDHSIEFSCGLAFTPNYEEIILPYSKMDEFCFCVQFKTKSLFEKGFQRILSMNDYIHY